MENLNEQPYDWRKLMVAPEEIKAECNLLENQMQQPRTDGMLRIRTFNNCIEEASNRPVPQMLFGKLWYEGELCILFADSNLGKSVLAIQIGNSISTGTSIEPFIYEGAKQPVLYCDFELNDKQLEARYTLDWQKHYRFEEHFYRADLNPDPATDYNEGQLEIFLYQALEEAIIKYDTRVLIIDNITYMRSETEQARDALPLMKQLKSLKNKYNLSILALAHTPKRDKSRPITSNDLQGSKMLMNFCDSSFAIGDSNNSADTRYIKQIKQRNTEQVYGDKNVCVFDLHKPDNFLHYAFKGNSTENEHLRMQDDNERKQLATDAAELRKQGLSLRQIGEQMGISFSKVNRLLKSIDDGQ
ncbi:MAG: AAA family ATPase [Mucilaginibacter sp.]